MRPKNQVIRDLNRETYLVTFPTELDADRVMAWLRSISGTLPRRSGSPFSKDTLVFETWATPTGITHRLMIPKGAAEYVAAQLRTHGRGITVTKDDTRPSVEWTAGVEVGMSSPLRQLRVQKHSDLAASLLGSVQALQEEEVVLMQWVVTPAKFERLPAKDTYHPSADFQARRSLLFGPSEATNDELQDRRAKLQEQNLIGIGRIMSKASTPKRSNELVLRVESALSAANSSANYFKSRAKNKKLAADANEAASVLLFPAQFSLTELAGVIAWPIGTPFVAGLSKGAPRHLFATADVPTVGRILGDSNFPGHERPIALDYKYATHHVVVAGASGTGKTEFMKSGFAQDVANGYGAIVIDAGDSLSDETMFSGALRLIPENRVDDVVVMDVSAGRDRPVGFNVFEQGSPEVLADQIMKLFANLFNDTSGVWVQQLLYHGVYTLASQKGLTFVDLVPLLNPLTKAEEAWSAEVISKVKDPDIREWWKRWNAFDKASRERYIQPLYNRIWQLVSRQGVRDIIGQTSSSFNIKEVLEGNKILLINLAGLDEATASILGTLLVNAIWTNARQSQPKKANFLYLDEFQVMTANLPIHLDDLLSRARKHNLGLVMATQHFKDKIPVEVKSAAINNARTKVIFRVASEEARTWHAEFDGSVEQSDFKGLNNYEVMAQVASETGSTSVTLRTRPPQRPTGTERRVIAMSREKYGRPIEAVAEERSARRVAEEKPTGKRPPIGFRPTEWGK